MRPHVSRELPKDEFKLLYQISAMFAAGLWLTAFLDMSGIALRKDPGDYFAWMYLYVTALPVACNEFFRLTHHRVWPRFDSFLGAAMLAAWGGVAAVLSIFYPDSPFPADFAQSFAGTVVIVSLARLSRWLSDSRFRADAPWTSPQACDALLAELEEADYKELAVDPRAPYSRRRAAELLRREGFLEADKLRFAPGVRVKWRRLVGTMLCELSSRWEGWTVPELVAFGSFKDCMDRPVWVKRALARLIERGYVEQVGASPPLYRATKVGYDVYLTSERIMEFLPYDRAMSLDIIRRRLGKWWQAWVEEAIEHMVMRDDAEPMVDSGDGERWYRSTFDWDAKYRLIRKPDETQEDDDSDSPNQQP